MHRRTLLHCLLLLCLLVPIAACSREPGDESTLDRVLARGILRVGTEPEFKPFESKNEHGEFVGFDIDLVRELAGDLEVELEIVEMAFPALIPSIRQARIDLAVSGMTATAERAKSVSFTDSYFETGLCLLVGADAGIESADGFGDRQLAVKQGTTGQINARRLFPNARITVMRTEGACVNEVVTGRADAFLYDQLSVLGASRAHPKTTRAILTPLTKEPYAMATPHGDAKFVTRLNEFLTAIRKDGRYQTMRDKYLKDLPDGSR